jgi:hypothetical protein
MPNLFTRGIKSCAVQIKGCLPPRKGLHVGKLSRIAIIQDYEDQKKQYHNLEKDYVVHGKPRSIRIPMVNTTEDKSPTRRRMQSTFIRS